MFRTGILFFILLFSIPALATQPIHIKRVIYITLDGVRWQDLFNSHTYFPLFWEKHARKAKIYGEPHSNRIMEVASIPVSLPSYQSQMSGKVQPGPCHHNECGRIIMETFPEALITKNGYQKKDVATFASWELTDFALESVPGTTYSNNGIRYALDPLTAKPDSVMTTINKRQQYDNVTANDRLDLHTYELAMHYYKKYQPTFLWLSFGNADDYAHRNDKDAYHGALRFYDQVIDSVISLLQELKLMDETMIIVTTDHGRGDGEKWTDHNANLPESKKTWALVFNGRLKADRKEDEKEYYSTLSIRPTIEGALLTDY